MNNDEKRLLEPEIKALVLDYLKNNGSLINGASVISELTLDGFSRRVDLALVNKKHLIAFEIKSEADSLDRLSGQIEKYSEYFDKVIVVAAPKHINAIMKTVPEHVAVWEIAYMQIKVKRRGKIVLIKDKGKLIDLMKANELLKLSNKLGLSTESKNRRSSEKRLQKASVRTLREAAIQYVINRFSMTSSLFWKGVGNDKILPKHIELLSPYREERQSLKAAKEERESFWNNLAKSFSEDRYLIELSQKKNKHIFGETPEHIQRLIAA
jgi:hypothetical protein